MAIDRWWLLLSQLTLAISIALLAIATIRVLARRWLFPRATYALWLLLPLSVIAVSLPATRKVVVIDPSPIVQTTAARAATPLLPEANSRPMLLLLWASGCAISWLGFALFQGHFVRRLRPQHIDGRIWRSPRTDVSPVVIGLWRPRIVLPADFELRFEADEQRLITDHETAHLQRLDVPANALAALIVGMFWFHPLVWLAWRQFRVDQEFACDADVLEQHPAARKTYAAAMLKAQLNLDALPLGCHWSRTHPLTRRIEMLKQPTPSRARIHAARILLTLFALSLSYGLWAQKPAVTIREHGASTASSGKGFSFGDRELIDFGITQYLRSPETGQLSLGVKQLAVRDAFLAAASLANLRVTNPALLSTTQTLDFELSDVPADTLLDTIASASKPPFAYVIDGDAITLSR